MVLCVVVVGSTVLEPMDCHFKLAAKCFLISLGDEGKDGDFCDFHLDKRDCICVEFMKCFSLILSLFHQLFIWRIAEKCCTYLLGYFKSTDLL